ncbi:MAG: DUF4270 family protein [Saprospiraceae bacterium]|nr:DUF4270 family protein [Saprospiraceae bacterium]
MRTLVFAGLCFALFALFTTACKRPTPFGSELLEEEYADLEFTDTITVQFTLEREDSVATSDRSGVTPYFLCGEVTDPVFGKYSSQIYTLFQPQTLNPKFDLTKIEFDSLVLFLNYSITGVYGDTLQSHNMQVYRLDEDLIYDSLYYSNRTLQTGAELGRINSFYPRPQFTDSLFDGVKGSFLRIRLDDNFGKELLAIDSITWLSDSTFYRYIGGLKIVVGANGATPGAMLAFDLNDVNLSRLSLFYTVKADTSADRFDFFFRNTNKFTHYDNVYEGKEVHTLIGKPLEDKLYLHGMHGLRLKATFPYANNLNDIAVNKAQLVLTVADDDKWLKPADQLVLTEREGDTTFAFTSDVFYALGSTGNGSLAAFGGFPEKEFVGGTPAVTRYRLALSEKFQHIIDDDAAPDIKNRTVYLNVYPRARSARRTLLYGPNNAAYPAKLELKYTKIK